MEASVDQTIGKLRDLFGAETDSELAKQLHLDKSTVSSWRSRGRVPERFTKLLTAEPSDLFPWDEPLEVLRELQPVAMPIALFRYSLLLNDPESGLADNEAMLAFLTNLLPFNSVIFRAAVDLRKRQKAVGVKPEVAQLLVLQDDIRDRQATLTRTREQLREDVEHNPGLVSGKP